MKTYKALLPFGAAKDVYVERTFHADGIEAFTGGMIVLRAGEHLCVVAAFASGTSVWEADTEGEKPPIPEGMA